MKKILATVCIFSFIFCLCSCRSGKKADGSDSAVSPAHSSARANEDIRLHSTANEIADGLYTGSLSDLSNEEKETIRSYLFDRNYKIEYKEDGTAELTRAGEKWIVTNKWIKNRYTQDVPEQTIGTVTMATEDLKTSGIPMFVIMIKSSGDADAYEKYKKSLIDSGFVSVGGEYNDDSDVFVAVKDNKIKIRISFTGKGYLLKIIKIDQSSGK